MVFRGIGILQGANGAGGPASGSAEAVGAVLSEGNAILVPSRTNLRHIKHRDLLIGTDHTNLRLQVVPELAVLFDGIDGDEREISLSRHFEIKLLVVTAAHRLTDNLRPELCVAVPLDPFGSPPCLDV